MKNYKIYVRSKGQLDHFYVQAESILKAFLGAVNRAHMNHQSIIDIVEMK